MLESLLRELPKTFDTSDIKQHLLLRAGIQRSLGQSLLLQTDTLHLFSRESQLKPFVEIPLSRTKRPTLKEDTFKTLLLLTKQDGSTLQLEVSSFEKDDCQTFLQQLTQPSKSSTPDTTASTEERPTNHTEEAPPVPPRIETTKSLDETSDTDTDILIEQIRTRLERDEKIQAVKDARDATGMSLKEAKEFVDMVEAESHEDRAASKDMHRQVAQYLQAGQKIQAVKYVREQTGLGLKEAKEFVDTIDWAQSHSSIEQQTPSTKEEQAKPTVTLIVWVILLIVFFAIYKYLVPN